VVLAGGAEQPRDLPVPGRELKGVHFAMDFLPQQNKVNAGDKLKDQIKATGKHVVVIGGGDTGSDCVGTSNRHGAASVTQFELMPMPPEQENKPLVWPYWPTKLRTSSSHEGCERDWAVATKRLEGKGGKVEKLIACRVEWKDGKMTEVPNRIRNESRSGAAGHGLCVAGGNMLEASASIKMHAATPRPAPTAKAATRPAESVCRRRHAPRPVAGGVGDPRRPPVRARGRRVPDGQFRVAALLRFGTQAPPDSCRVRMGDPPVSFF
jgi:NADPH-dependent glutamate synthase beta subunit-like oxidoreductase